MARGGRLGRETRPSGPPVSVMNGGPLEDSTYCCLAGRPVFRDSTGRRQSTANTGKRERPTANAEKIPMPASHTLLMYRLTRSRPPAFLVNSDPAMKRRSPSDKASFSISGTVASFYDLLESANMKRWSKLWAEQGVYLNPFANGTFPRQRVAGREHVVDLITTMRSRFDTVEFQGRVIEPALVPENPALVVYVTGDCHYALPDAPQMHRHHVHHRLEILDGSVTGWIDYTNPLTKSDIAPDAKSERWTSMTPTEDHPAIKHGDGASPATLVPEVSV